MFVASLPVSGRTGTLRYRLSDKGMAGRVRAKTGTLDGVSALSGYVTTNSGRTVAFSVIANNYNHSVRATTIRGLIDEVVEVLAR
jgi:D-alanyl-D-alanine carboxypeptidase/D-alanyl-D-alanine-endopeptidase (penicillin-binding protein 4)